MLIGDKPRFSSLNKLTDGGFPIGYYSNIVFPKFVGYAYMSTLDYFQLVNIVELRRSCSKSSLDFGVLRMKRCNV